MARVTVEDCTKIIPSRFELVVIAAQRAKEISAGAKLTIEREKDKNPVVALREIAEEKLDLDALRDIVIKNHMVMQANVDKDMPGDSFGTNMSMEVEQEVRSLASTDSDEDLEDNFIDIDEEELGKE